MLIKRSSRNLSGRTPPGRDRAGGICIADGHLLVIERNRPSYGRYFVTPGGGIEPGENLAAAIVRELREETGLKAAAVREVFYGYTPTGGRHSYWLVTARKLPVALPTRAEENNPARVAARGTVRPRWVPVALLSKIRLLPPSLKAALITAVRIGFLKRSLEINEKWS